MNLVFRHASSFIALPVFNLILLIARCRLILFILATLKFLIFNRSNKSLYLFLWLSSLSPPTQDSKLATLLAAICLYLALLASKSSLQILVNNSSLSCSLLLELESSGKAYSIQSSFLIGSFNKYLIADFGKKCSA